MFCAVIGQRYIWFFNAPNKAEGRKIANNILFFESIGAEGTLSGFDPAKGYFWKAVAKDLTDETKELMGKADENKIIEIKKKRSPTIHAIYLTRLQKERWPSPSP